jgi:hypothetical protein
MAESRKILGQTALAATTLTDIYTVPAATQAIASSIVICNRSASSTTFRVSIAVAGASDTNAQYIYYDVPIPGNETFIATIGITLEATDVVRVWAGAATLSVNLMGVEIT